VTIIADELAPALELELAAGVSVTAVGVPVGVGVGVTTPQALSESAATNKGTANRM